MHPDNHILCSCITLSLLTKALYTYVVCVFICIFVCVCRQESSADVTISVGDDDFVKISTGKLNSQQAFMKGKLKVRGGISTMLHL